SRARDTPPSPSSGRRSPSTPSWRSSASGFTPDPALPQTRPMAEHGYDPDFLDVALAPPRARERSHLLDYTHFSLQMHAPRRLASWVAWNVDGLSLFSGDSISRAGEDFRADPRIPDAEQTLDDAYAGNELDRGHIARRSDLLWGT